MVKNNNTEIYLRHFIPQEIPLSHLVHFMGNAKKPTI